MKRLFSLLLLGCIFFSSCKYMGDERIKGDGNVTTEQRDASGFSGLEVSGAIRVILTQDSQYAVKVKTDANLQAYVEVYVSGNKLHIKPQNNVNPDPSDVNIVYVNAQLVEDIRGLVISRVFAYQPRPVEITPVEVSNTPTAATQTAPTQTDHGKKKKRRRH